MTRVIFPDIFPMDAFTKDDAEFEPISFIFDELGNRSARQFVAITHWAKSACAKNYANGVHDKIISGEDIRDEYRGRNERTA